MNVLCTQCEREFYTGNAEGICWTCVAQSKRYSPEVIKKACKELESMVGKP